MCISPHGTVSSAGYPVDEGGAPGPRTMHGAGADVAQGADMGAGRILLSEDDPLTCDVLVDTLARDGHDVRVCESLQHVMTAADRMPRSLALMDFWGTSYRRLADHEGRQVVRLARAVPTILLTGRPWANEQIAAEL